MSTGTATIATAEIPGRSGGCGDEHFKCLLYQRHTTILFLSKKEKNCCQLYYGIMLSYHLDILLYTYFKRSFRFYR